MRLRPSNVIIIDLCRDFWGYISLGYLRQRAVAGEVGSSTMPHKVNPIDFENAEGNCGIANALLRHFAEKLPLSRWQRDLTDSTVLRNLGVALGHTLIAWQSLARGLAKIEADPQRIAAGARGRLGSPGRGGADGAARCRVPDGYERLKEFTRGRAIDGPSLAAFIDALPLPAPEKARLQRPQTGSVYRARRTARARPLRGLPALTAALAHTPEKWTKNPRRPPKVRTAPRF